jgi:hypothetical protein
MYRGLEENPEENRPLGRLRYRWKDSMKVVLKDLEWGGNGLDSSGHYGDNWWVVVNTVMKLGFS